MLMPALHACPLWYVPFDVPAVSKWHPAAADLLEGLEEFAVEIEVHFVPCSPTCAFNLAIAEV